MPFQGLVKAFFLNTFTKYRHYTVSATAIDAFYTFSAAAETRGQTADPDTASGRNDVSYGQLRHVDLCIMYLVTDPPNRQYAAVLQSFIHERNRYHRPTWIYTKYPTASATFQDMYGGQFAAFLETPELQLLKVTTT